MGDVGAFEGMVRRRTRHHVTISQIRGLREYLGDEASLSQILELDEMGRRADPNPELVIQYQSRASAQYQALGEFFKLLPGMVPGPVGESPKKRYSSADSLLAVEDLKLFEAYLRNQLAGPEPQDVEATTMREANQEILKKLYETFDFLKR